MEFEQGAKPVVCFFVFVRWLFLTMTLQCYPTVKGRKSQSADR